MTRTRKEQEVLEAFDDKQIEVPTRFLDDLADLMDEYSISLEESIASFIDIISYSVGMEKESEDLKNKTRVLFEKQLKKTRDRKVDRRR